MPSNNQRRPIPDYFLIYIQTFAFHYNRNQNVNKNFERLSLLMNWDDEDYYAEKRNLENQQAEQVDELVAQVNQINFSNLEVLQNILRRYRVTLGLNAEQIDSYSVRKCKKVLNAKLFVNIWDFLEPTNNTAFATLRELSAYTLRNFKTFPKEEAKRVYANKMLLREIVRGRNRHE